MAERVLRGMTWGHRRAIDPLIATLPEFQHRHPGIKVTWDSRPLHGFEFTPVEELAQRYDLIILDPPFCGDIVRTRALLPLDEMVTPALETAFVGPSLATYRYENRIWALPVDAACQVAVARPDLLTSLDRRAPTSWSEMLQLGEAAGRKGLHLAIGLRGVHSLMTFFTLAANMGRPCAVDPGQDLIDRETARQVLDAIKVLLAHCPPQALDWNSIELHDVMVARDDLVFCPAVYCYATYAEADIAHPLRFSNLPGLSGSNPLGSTIGGAGLGISARVEDREAAFAYARYLMESATQKAFAAHHGQPARADSWEDPAIAARFGGCYSDTRATMEGCWIRPRYAGYLAFQAAGGTLIEQHLRGEMSFGALFDRLSALHRESAKPQR
jgi:multiple sugar transport system substrate-binding protein